jgi:GntR family transcriptional regulator of vanillate catabolism
MRANSSLMHIMSSAQKFPRELPASGEEAGSQAIKAQQRLRELILTGTLAAGARIAELALVDLLGVSRTPIRAALMRLEQEGLLEALPSGGYAVRTFSERDVADAIELRGTLEGLAARLAAERGVATRTLAQARGCLDQIDRVLLDPSLSEEMFSEYVRLNAEFHRLLAAMPGSGVLAREIERAGSLPFASPSGFVGVQVSNANSAPARDLLVVAQHQHRQVLDAIESRQAGRAEALMREHSRIAQHNMQVALRQPGGFDLPGVQLIRPN